MIIVVSEVSESPSRTLEMRTGHFHPLNTHNAHTRSKRLNIRVSFHFFLRFLNSKYM